MRMSLSKLNEAIFAGIGQGHWDRYKPWLWIRRKNASPVSNQVVAKLPGYSRGHHFFATSERILALVVLWLGRGSVDVREQFPMWPMEHDHPLADSGYWQAGPAIPGLLDIAAEAGIDHGWCVGAPNIPYVGTMDLMCTIYGKSTASLAAISLKPYQKLLAAEPTDRILERHELERRYMKALSAPWTIVDRSITNITLRANLIRAAGAATKTRFELDAQHEDFFRTIERVPEAGFDEAIRLASVYTGIPRELAQEVFFAGAWSGQIDVDLSRPLVGRQPICIDNGLRARLSQELLGRTL